MGKLDDALRMVVMPRGPSAIYACEHVLMREVMFLVVGMESDDATQLREFTDAIQGMDEDEYWEKVGMIRLIVTDIAPHVLVKASGWDDANALEAIGGVQSALGAIRHARD